MARTRHEQNTTTLIFDVVRDAFAQRHRDNCASGYSYCLDGRWRKRQCNSRISACRPARAPHRARHYSRRKVFDDTMNENSRTAEQQKALFEIQQAFPPEMFELLDEWATE